MSQLIFGASWGVMFGTYFMTVLGDISTESREKYYALGSAAFLLYFILPLIPNVFDIKFDDATPIACLLAVILFTAIPLLMRGPETLSSEKIRQRTLKDHLKKVKKLVGAEEPHD